MENTCQRWRWFSENVAVYRKKQLQSSGRSVECFNFEGDMFDAASSPL
jgi:hypothetical protein